MKSAIIIPALNEEDAIGQVVANVRHKADRVIVVDNGSTDRTAEIAANAGAEIATAYPPGYGRACLAGVAAARDADLLIFMDGDGADATSQEFLFANSVRDCQFDGCLHLKG